MTSVTRDKKVCLERLVKKNDTLLAREGCRIQVPERWFGVGLGSLTGVATVYGFFPILFADNVYGVVNACALVDLSPSRTTMVTIQDEPYYEFHFDEGAPIIKNLNLVRQDTLTFNVMDELFMKGKVPWWATVDDLCSIFDTADRHADSKIAKVPQTIEFLVGIIARKTEDRAALLRRVAKSADDYRLENIEFVPLKSVQMAVNNTVSKLSGAYFNDGVTSAIVRPASKASKVEKILRA